MKILTIMYDRISSRYGINESQRDEFYQDTHIIQNSIDNATLEEKVESILGENDLLKRKMGLKLARFHLCREDNEYQKSMNLANIIKKLNPKAVIIK